MTTTQPILVLGGTGKTGRRVVDRLQARGLPVRVGSRSGQHPFEWEDSSTWAGALDGVGAVYISYFPDLAAPGAPEAVGGFTRLAVASGVRRLVLLSGRGEEEAQASEQRLIESGADWTIVRASWFMQNFNESYMLEPVQAGQVVLPRRERSQPFIDADDIADVAVAALTDDRHIGQLYEVTGPRALTFADAVGEIAKAAGRPIGYLRIPTEEYAAALHAEDVPEDIIGLLNYLFDTVLDGRNVKVTVQRALGRPARDFADWARDVATTGVWDGGSA